jgi:origin recognition complex subunit 3
MCHFYSNALSIVFADPTNCSIHFQPEHLEAIRHLPSFRALVERIVEAGTREDLAYAESLLDNDQSLTNEIKNSSHSQQEWISKVLRALLVIDAAGAQFGDFSAVYAEAMAKGVSVTDGSPIIERIRRMDVKGLIAFIGNVVSIIRDGRQSLHLDPGTTDDDAKLRDSLMSQLADLDKLREDADKLGIAPRSKYSGQRKVHRTTVIAQRVQLSKDTAALRDEDKRLTTTIDAVVDLLITALDAPPPSRVFLSECWIYDSRSPARDVFVPRPRLIFERGLTRPHDYLGCECCKPGESGLQSTLPPLSILYQLYMETGSLINVADLWTAYQGLVSQIEDDERKVLLMFYRGLAELRAFGFVKNSTKKADHIAKLKWL